MTPSLLATKIYTPHLRPDVVPRPHLIERLKAGLQCPLTLVSASAGYGKTTLLVELANNVDLPAAWLSLDEGDNDPVRFWTHFISALHTKEPHIGNTALQILGSPESMDIQSALTELINELAFGEPSMKPCILVLDDYHLIEEQSIHKDLSFVIEHLPSQLHLVVSTRADPPLPLARMRARGQLSEFRAQDLRFTMKETNTLLNNTMGLGLSDEELAAINARSEGWIASLQMAAISMQRREDIPAFIAAFTGTHRHVLDYLIEEVLDRQTKDTRSFLLETSILNRMTGPLCDAITGRQDGQEMIERLDKANLFLISLDDERKWYRYHNLFSSMLSSRLKRLKPGHVTNLRKNAATWFQRNGLMEEAIFQALAARDFYLSSRLIAEAAPASVIRGEQITLLNWLDKVPERIIQKHAGLCIFYAYALNRVGRIDAAEAWLRRAEGMTLPGFLKTMATMTQAMIATSHRDDEHAMELLYQIVNEREGPSDASVSSEVAYDLAVKLGAAMYLVEAQETHGQLRKAIDTCQWGLKLVQNKALEAPWLSTMTSLLHVLLARILCERNELEDANEHIVAAGEIAQRSDNKQIMSCISIVLGLIRQAEGNEKAALNLMREAEEIVPSRGLLPRTVSNLPWRLRLWFALGDFKSAAEFIRAYEPAPGTGQGGPLVALLQETVGTALGHISLSEGKFDEAEALLTRAQEEAERAGRLGNVIEILPLRALAAQAVGNKVRAMDLLNRAMSLAEPEGYIRVFIDLGMPMAALLREVVSQDLTSNYARQLLAEFEKKRHYTKTFAYQPLVEALTEREFEVLHLLADCLSNEEIAEKLVLTVSTVKTHAHNIYAKLGVNNRAQAIKRATSLNLL